MLNADLLRKIKRLESRIGRVEPKLPGGMVASTHTPTYQGSTAGGATTYSVQQGWYWRIGNLLFVTGAVAWTAATGTGDARISLPFAPSATIGFRATVNVRTSGVTFANGSIQGIVAPAAAYFTMESPITNGLSTTVAMEAAGNVTFSCFYGVD